MIQATAELRKAVKSAAFGKSSLLAQVARDYKTTARALLPYALEAIRTGHVGPRARDIAVAYMQWSDGDDLHDAQRLACR
jgi:hypothetical protein